MKIITIDPGVTTGYGSGAVFAHGEIECEFGQNSDQLDFCAWLDAELREERETEGQTAPIVVVCEEFRITQATLRKSRQTASLELIGVARWLADKWDAQFVLQAPADAKRLGTDARLKALGWWTPGKDHANDAARHMLLYAVRNRLVNPLEVDHADS